MNKQIFVINGSGGVGKDTFVKLVSDELNDIMKRFHTVVNFRLLIESKKLQDILVGMVKKQKKTENFYLI
ncbi:hypothetical protein C823_007718 [Eubacterium plexicaudatum ASF492]|nr:hypothetical protein C823_007718 [Eubacterium plexicaudatum ASF492]